MSDMRRREFITLIGGAAVAWPLAARAQQAGRTYRLGVLHNQGPQSPQFPPFYDELRRLGFVEGQNLIVDSRGYAVRTEQFPAVAAELVKAQVDAILDHGTRLPATGVMVFVWGTLHPQWEKVEKMGEFYRMCRD